MHKGLVGPDERVTEVVAAVREAVGPEMTIMVDVQYAFDSVERRCASSRHGQGSTSSSSRRRSGPTTSPVTPSSRRVRRCAIAAGEWLSTRHDFAALIDGAASQVAQPDIGRVGGFTEARRVCDLAADAAG